MFGRKTPSGRTTDGLIHTPPGGFGRDVGDHRRLRQGRVDIAGFRVGSYVQSPPLFFTRDGHAAPLCDMYRGSTAFLICGGPSFATLDPAGLAQPGILTMGLNNSPKTFRPRLWCSVDDPTHYLRSIWLDPTITKFVPFCHAEKPIFDSDAWRLMDAKAGDCPNVWFYRRNEHFVPEQFLFEDTINWGNHAKAGGGRSVMMAAVRILFLLGVRRLFLLGADFRMSEASKYHFEQARAPGSIAGNNATYRQLNQRFAQLRPIFERHGYDVFNCNPASALTAFDHVPYDEALALARAALPADLSAERTAGLYERTAVERAKHLPAQVKPTAATRGRAVAPSARPNPGRGVSALVEPAFVTDGEKADGTAESLRAAIDATATARDALHQAKAAYDAVAVCDEKDARRTDPIEFAATLSTLNATVRLCRAAFRASVDRRESLRRSREPV